MRVPRVRLSVRRMIVAVAGVALLLAGVSAILRRPYPVRTMMYPVVARTADGRPLLPIAVKAPDGPIPTIFTKTPNSPYQEVVIQQHWSDGRVRTLAANEPRVEGLHRYGPLLRVEWSDGTMSYYIVAPRTVTPGL